MMTSRVPSAHGARGNGIPLPLDSTTFADLLAEAGYRTALIGKSHLQNMEDRPALLPPVVQPDGVAASIRYLEARHPADDGTAYRQELRSSWERPEHALRLPFYGFQEVVLCNHHGDECFGDWLRWLRAGHPDSAKQLGREHGLKDPRYVAPQAWRTRLDEETYPTNFIAHQSAQWLKRHATAHAGEPFALMCSFPDPHHPWTPPGRYWDMFDPDAMPLPSSMPGDAALDPAASDSDAQAAAAAQPSHVRWLLEERRRGAAKLDSPRLFAATRREVREMIALTYGMIANIDDRIGMVMQGLRESGLDRDTVVIFTSDHGDLMGDHGLVLKGPLHYQGLVRVPFIWRDLAAGAVATAHARVSEDLVSTLDLGASLLQRAGIAPVNGMQGRALFSPAGMPLAVDRDAVLIEENQQRAYLGFEDPVQMRTIVTATHRMSVFVEGDWGELYDLVADPDEMRNLWDDAGSATIKSRLLLRVAKLMIEHSESSPRPTHLA